MAQVDFREFNRTLPKLKIPSSIARFPWVTRPQTQHDPDGVYKVEQILDPSNERHAALLATLEKIRDRVAAELGKVKAKKMYVPWTEQVDEDGDPTGKFIVKASTKAKRKDRKTGEITDVVLPVVDGAKNPVKAPVYGGSTLVCATKPSAYDSGANCGFKLYLNAVRVVDLVSADGLDDLYDDDDDDDVGYVASPAVTDDDVDGDSDDDADY